MSPLPRSAPPLGLTTGHSRLIMGFNIGCFLLATISVMLRIYARRLKKASFVAEDYFVFAALFGFFVQAILTCCAVILGAAGHPQSTVSAENVEASLKILGGQGPTYGTIMICSKWSICLLYKRIFILKSFRIITYILMALILGWGILAFVVTWGFCVPIAYGWDPTIPGGHCANRDAGYLVVGILDAIIDFFMWILPLPVVWKLQVPRVRQISLIVIFSIAVLCMVVSAIRAYYTSTITEEDFTDSRTLLDVLSAIEPATSIIVASSLVLGPVIQKWFSGSILTHTSPSYQSFRRIEEHRSNFKPSDIELRGTRTAIHGPNEADLQSLDGISEQGLKRTVEPWAAGLRSDGIAVQREIVVYREL